MVLRNGLRARGTGEREKEGPRRAYKAEDGGFDGRAAAPG